MTASNALPTAGSVTSEVLVGRQPIFDAKLNVVAYELLYRSSGTNRADVQDQHSATSQVIVNTFMDIGLTKLVGDKTAYINMPAGFLTGEFPIPFPESKVALEVLEHVEVTPALVESLRKLAKQGYPIALDDFVLKDDKLPLLELAQVVKIDVLAMKFDEVRKSVVKLRPRKLKLLAEKIETQEMFDECKKLGFHFFQGYFLCKPVIVKGTRLSPNRLQLMRVLAELNNPNLEFKQLEQLISQDVALSYKMLAVINSAQYSMSQKVDSLRQALVLLGIKNIKSWATLVTLTSIDNKPSELFMISLMRAKLCELLARALKTASIESCFTVGLFSTLDALLDQSFDVLLSSLALSDEVNAALLERKGPMGEILRSVIAFERGDWANVKLPGVSTRVVQDSYLEAARWAKDICSQLGMK